MCIYIYILYNVICILCMCIYIYACVHMNIHTYMYQFIHSYIDVYIYIWIYYLYMQDDYVNLYILGCICLISGFVKSVWSQINFELFGWIGFGGNFQISDFIQGSQICVLLRYLCIYIYKYIYKWYCNFDTVDKIGDVSKWIYRKKLAVSNCILDSGQRFRPPSRNTSRSLTTYGKAHLRRCPQFGSWLQSMILLYPIITNLWLTEPRSYGYPHSLYIPYWMGSQGAMNRISQPSNSQYL